jgi:hypothetical protein
MRYRIINIAIALGVPLVASIPFAFLVWDDAYADPLSIYFFMFTGLIAIFGYFVAYVLDVLRCLAFCGQSNSLFFNEKDGRSDGQQQVKWEDARASFILGRV